MSTGGNHNKCVADSLSILWMHTKQHDCTACTTRASPPPPPTNLDDTSSTMVLSWMGKAIPTSPLLGGVHNDVTLPHHLVIGYKEACVTGEGGGRRWAREGGKGA